MLSVLSVANPLPQRREDWPERLSAYVEAAKERPFCYGAHDCATFAAGAVEAVTGDNPMAEVAAYERKGAAAYMRGGLHKLAAKHLGQEVAPLFVRRGDVVGFTWEGRQTLGVCLGAVIAATGPHGLVFLPLATASKAWRV